MEITQRTWADGGLSLTYHQCNGEDKIGSHTLAFEEFTRGWCITPHSQVTGLSKYHSPLHFKGHKEEGSFLMLVREGRTLTTAGE